MPLLNNASSVMVRTFEPDLYRSRLHLRQVLAQVAVISVICTSILVPGVIRSQDFPLIKAEIAILPLVFLLYAWFLLAGIVRKVRWNGMFLIGALYSICFALSTWYGSAMLGQTVILRDFYELPKLWLPVAFFTLAYEAELSEAALQRLLSVFAVALGLICFYAWAQWVGLRFASWLDNIYSAGEHVEVSLLYARRVFSTMGNPNVLGQLMTWSVAAFVLAILLRAGNQTRNILVTLACLITLAMTGSRYGLVDTGLALILVVAMPVTPTRHRLPQFVLPFLLLALFASAVLMVANTNQRTLERFQTLRNPLAMDSFRQRVDNLWRDAVDDFSKSPFLGYGPAKTIFTGIITDSEYLDVLKRFGIFGFIFYLGYYFVPLVLIWGGMRAAQRAGPGLEKRTPATFLAMHLSFVLIITALVMNIGMSTFYSELVRDFLFIWIGLGARAAKSIGDASTRYPWALQMGFR